MTQDRIHYSKPIIALVYHKFLMGLSCSELNRKQVYLFLNNCTKFSCFPSQVSPRALLCNMMELKTRYYKDVVGLCDPERINIFVILSVDMWNHCTTTKFSWEINNAFMFNEWHTFPPEGPYACNLDLHSGGFSPFLFEQENNDGNWIFTHGAHMIWGVR